MPVVCGPRVPNAFFTGLLNAVLIEGAIIAAGWAIWTYIL